MKCSETIVEKHKPISVPQTILRRVGIKAGDWVQFTAHPGKITIRKASAPKQRRPHAPRR